MFKNQIRNQTGPFEIEVKLRCDNIEFLTRAGLILDLETARHFEDNWLLDTPDQQLGLKASILRVRSAQGTGSMTLKERSAPDAPVTQFKQRVEIETGLNDPESAIEIFERLGYRKWFRYQKYRTVYRARLAQGKSLHVMFDETPLGNFIELEGEEEDIAEAVRMLGVTSADYILESYLALQAEHCRRQGKQLEDMVFLS
ncbi:MAG: class IV adenylate cyclase [Acidobacteria bacterium]|nr:class IV adenylate cyclase [Acidobacteriota bacterium]MCI0663350.1 class IV adenylate cyclase [Acidobacteriota bacterium]